MEKYLISLLELNNRVIVPDLGAFIIRQQEPKELVFNDLLAFDDGMLTDRITQEENLSKAEARARIRQFVEKVKKILDGDEPFHLENLGSLKMDTSGKIEYSTTETEEDVPFKKDIVDETPEEPAEETPSDAEDAPVVEPEETTEEEKPLGETLPEPGVKGVAVVEPREIQKEDKPVEEALAGETDEMATEPVGEKTETAADQEGFILEDGDAEVDVDATRDDTPLEPDREEPPFSIDEAMEAEIPLKQEEAVETPGDESSEEPEPEQELETEMEPEPEPEQEPEPLKELVKDPLNELAKDTVGPERREGPEEREEPDEPKETPVFKPVSTYTQPYQSRRKSWPWIAGSAAIVALLLAITWFMFPEIVNSILRKEVSETVLEDKSAVSESGTEISPVQEPEGTDKEAEKIPETVPDEAPGTREPVPDVQSAVKQYYVVAGCFEDLKNAENYVRTLRNKGYDASIFGMRKNLHAVCFNAHPSKQAAVEELQRIQDRIDPNAWVLFY